MKRGTRMQPTDAAGLPNCSGGASKHAPLRTCPVCQEEPPVEATTGGVTWKWLANHFARHLGYEWTSGGWASIQQSAASNDVIPQSITTTHDDE